MFTAQSVSIYALQIDDGGNVFGEASEIRTYSVEEVHNAGVEPGHNSISVEIEHLPTEKHRRKGSSSLSD
jgi:hypothetical protein